MKGGRRSSSSSKQKTHLHSYFEFQNVFFFLLLEKEMGEGEAKAFLKDKITFLSESSKKQIKGPKASCSPRNTDWRQTPPPSYFPKFTGLFQLKKSGTPYIGL